MICPCLLCVCLHVVTKYSCTQCDFVFLVEIEMRKITTDICLNTFKKIFLGYFLLILWSNSKTFLSIIGFPEGKKKNPQQINGMYLNTIFKHYNHCCSNYLKLLMHLNFTYSLFNPSHFLLYKMRLLQYTCIVVSSWCEPTVPIKSYKFEDTNLVIKK